MISICSTHPRRLTKARASATPLGLIAQDLQATRGFGPSDHHTPSVDADSRELAAIQGLNEKVEVENAALRSELKVKDANIQALEQRLFALEKLITNTK